ncbi:hypothetical protein LP420_29065 [Massilia sp. B-10]|nr:hypothetical protein LP420_29065 [Massilia sp. B-10]
MTCRSALRRAVRRHILFDSLYRNVMNTRFLNLPRIYKQLIAASFDFVCLPLLLYFSLILHLDGFPDGMLAEYSYLALGAAFVGLPVFLRLGMYRAVIRYIRHEIAVAAVCCASVTAGVLAAAQMLIWPGKLSITPFLIFWASSVLYILASRFAARRWLHSRGRLATKVRVAIYGAKRSGQPAGARDFARQ